MLVLKVTLVVSAMFVVFNQQGLNVGGQPSLFCLLQKKTIDRMQYESLRSLYPCSQAHKAKVTCETDQSWWTIQFKSHSHCM